MWPGRASLTGSGTVPRRKLCVPTGVLLEGCFCPVSDPALTLLSPRPVLQGWPSDGLSGTRVLVLPNITRCSHSVRDRTESLPW